MWSKITCITKPCFIIAEAGVNHNGNFKLAKKLIDIAVQASADAVKFQTFQTKNLVTASAACRPNSYSDRGRKK